MVEEALTNQKEYTYAAFISYCHGELDIASATRLHYKLENYWIPRSIMKQKKIKRKIGKVFLDTKELRATSNLTKEIEDALRASKYLIVVCSPETPKSEWCCLEIKKFREFHGNNRILPILIEGEPAEAFPHPLSYQKAIVHNLDGSISEYEDKVIPLAADIRGSNPDEMWKKLRDEKLKILATMIGVQFDELKQRHKERFIKNTVAVTLSISLIFTVFSAFALYQSNIIASQSSQLEKRSEEVRIKNEELEKTNRKLKDQIRETNKHAKIAKENEKLAYKNALTATSARKKAEEQRDQALKNQSLYLANLSREQVKNGDRIMGMLLALEALPKDLQNPERPFVGEAESALYNTIYNCVPLVYDSNKKKGVRYDKGQPLLKGCTIIKNNNVVSADISTDGKVIMIFNEPKIIIYDADTGQLLKIFDKEDPAMKDYPMAAHFISSKEVIIGRCYDEKKGGGVRATTFDIATGDKIYEFSNLQHYHFSRESNRLLLFTKDGQLSIHALDTGKRIKTIFKSGMNLSLIQFCNDGSKLLVRGESTNTYFIDAITGDVLLNMDLELEKQVGYCLNDNGTVMVDILEDRLTVYDLIHNKIVLNYPGELNIGFGQFNKAINSFVLIDRKGVNSKIITIRLDDYKLHEKPFSYSNFSVFGLFNNCVELTPDGKKIVMGGAREAIILDVETGKKLATLAQGDSQQTLDYCGVKISPDGKTVLTYSQQKEVKLWNVDNGDQLAKFDQPMYYPISSVGFAKGSNKFYIVSPRDGVYLWELGKPDMLHICETGSYKPEKILFNKADNTLLAYTASSSRSVTNRSHLNIWSLGTGELISSQDTNYDYISHDLRVTAVLDYVKNQLDYSKIILSNKKELHYGGRVNSVKFSPDDSKIIVGYSTGVAIVWDVKSGAPLFKLETHPTEVSDATFSPDGRYIATISGDKVFIWSAQNGKPITVLTKHAEKINSAEFSPDGKLIVIASTDCTIWDVQSGIQLKILNQHTDTVNHARFSPDGKRIVSASTDKTARVWDVKSGQVLAILDMHEWKVLDALYSPDGRKIVTTGDDDYAIIWETFANTEDLVNYVKFQLKCRRLTDSEERKFFLGR